MKAAISQLRDKIKRLKETDPNFLEVKTELEVELANKEQELLAKYRGKCDIRLNDINVEVKVTKGTTAKNFYDADIVLVCNLKDGQIYLYKRQSDALKHVHASGESAAYIKLPKPICRIVDLDRDIKFVKAQTNVAAFQIDDTN